MLHAMLQQKFIVQVTTLPDCDDITRFDGSKKNLDLYCFVTSLWRFIFDKLFKFSFKK